MIRYVIYCNCEIPEQEYVNLPGIPGHTFLGREELDKINSPGERMQRIIETSVTSAVRRFRESRGKDPDVLFLKDGLYGIPEIQRQ